MLDELKQYAISSEDGFFLNQDETLCNRMRWLFSH